VNVYAGSKMKKLIRRLIGGRFIAHARMLRDRLRLASIKVANSCFGVSRINLGAGMGAEAVGWWTGDVQTGFVFDEKTRLPMKDSSVEFAFSSMFFEHINDATALNLLREVRRVLKPGHCFRLIVPDFDLYIRKYKENDRNFFYNPDAENFKTWAAMGVPLDMEHFLISVISAIHNLPHEMVQYPWQENFKSKPPKVYHPFQTRLPGYYCGPAPEFSTVEIREKLDIFTNPEFLNWVFSVTNESKYQDPTFNSWHKNWWSLEKLNDFAILAGFSKVTQSSFGEAPYALGDKYEKPQHASLGLYFNILG
jgi:SAM-dependent methyltransferase